MDRSSSFYWRRATSAAAWASTLSALFAWWIGSQAFFATWVSNIPGAETLQLIVHSEGKASISLPWQMILYLSARVFMGIIVSLTTRQSNSKHVDLHYTLLGTPVIKEEPNSPEPCMLPDGSIPQPRRVFFSNTDLEIPIPSKRSIVGFSIGWACVISIVLFVYWISKV